MKQNINNNKNTPAVCVSEYNIIGLYRVHIPRSCTPIFLTDTVCGYQTYSNYNAADGY